MAKKNRRKGRLGSAKRASDTPPGKPAFPFALEPSAPGRKCSGEGGSRRIELTVQSYNRQRRAASEAREPLDFRAQHGALEGDRGASVERLSRALPDAEGRIGNPHRTYDTLATLKRNGAIDDAELEAGRAFEEDFNRARLNSLHASNPARIPASGVAELSDSMVAGRQRVNRAITALGGTATPAGAAVWCILGEGRTVKEWAAACQFGQARGSLDQKVAKGIFVAALGVLAAHYGTSRRGQRSEDRGRQVVP